MTKTLGLIGSGDLGSSIARLACDAGYAVVLSNSRHPDTLADLASDLGGNAAAATPVEAARASDVVVLSVPLFAINDLPVDDLAGKVVIDTTNYYPERDGQIEALDDMELTASELVQRALPRSHVVKALNNVGAKQLYSAARPPEAPDRSALPVAGDHGEAKAVTAQLLDALGFDTVDIGPLNESWRSEPSTPVYVVPFLGPMADPRDINEVARRMQTASGISVNADEVNRLLAAAHRGQPGGQRPTGD